MARDVWEASAHGEPEGQGASALVPAAALPRVADILTESLNAMSADWKGYFLVGLGYTLATIPLIVAAVLGVYAGMLPGLLAAGATQDATAAIIGFAVGLSAAGAFLLAILVVVSGPLTAGLYRAMAANLDDGAPLTLGGSFSSLFRDLGRIVPVVVAQLALTLSAAMFCYFPGLVVAAALHFALPAVVLSRVGPVDALRASARLFRQHPGWGVGAWGVGFLILLVSSNIPFVGNAFGTPLYVGYQLRLFRRAFGVGATTPA